jgi:hypothetical protein
MRYIGCCINLNGDDINEIKDSSKEIQYRTFIKNVGSSAVSRLSDTLGYTGSRLTLSSDWHVRFIVENTR